MIQSSTTPLQGRSPACWLAVSLLLSSSAQVSGFSSHPTPSLVVQPHLGVKPSRIGSSQFSSSTKLFSTVEQPPPGQPTGYAGTSQTSLGQAAVVVGDDFTRNRPWDNRQKPWIWRKMASLIHDLSPAATSETVPSYKRLLVFASTMGLVLISEPLLSLVDTSVVGWTQGATSVVQLAAMGPATTLMDTLIYMTYFLALGTNNLLSQGLAESKWRDLQQTTSHILAVATLVGLGLTGLIWFASPFLLKAMAGASATPELLKYAVSYTRIRALVAPAAIVGLVAQAFCMANQSTRAPVLAVLVASIVNISGDLLLAKQGVVGAAIATGVATVAACSLLLVAVKRRLNSWRQKEVQEWEDILPGKPMEPAEPALESTSLEADVPKLVAESNDGSADVEPLKAESLEEPTTEKPSEEPQLSLQSAEEPPTTEEMEVTKPSVPPRVPFLSLPGREALVRLASVSGPLCFNMWAKMGCYSALTLAATRFGVVSLAAHNILMRLFFFFGCFADSIGMCAQTFLPRSLYPVPNKSAYRATKRRLMALAAVAAVFLGKATTSVLGAAGSYLARDGAMLTAMQTQGPFLAIALFLHPLVVLTEGTVIATRDFRNLIMTYASTVCVHAFLLGNAASFTAVWKALVGFQVVRMLNYRVWRKRSSSVSPSSQAPESSQDISAAAPAAA